jgi:monovalent cation:H+ antiporter-2, CPA2 family
MNSIAPSLLLFATAPPLDAVFIELGAAIVGLAILTRLAHRLAFSAIPLYLLGGLAFGNGGLLPIQFTEDFLHVGSEIGVILLLFVLGLETNGDELSKNLRTGLPAGLVDLGLNFVPGFVAALLLRWGPLAAILLGGVTYISSSGIVARVLTELGRMQRPETPTILSILVLEDLAMAAFLPLVAVLLLEPDLKTAAISVTVALVTVSVVLLAALRFGGAISRVVVHSSDEVVLLSTFGIVLLVAGIAQRLQVSAAIGAFLVGVALSGPLAKQTHRLVGPLRDLFAALFFLVFGLLIDPKTLVPVLVPAAILAAATAATKIATGRWAARRAGVDAAGAWRAGGALIARGEFSIVIAGLGASLPVGPELGALTAAYVLMLAIAGPVLARLMPDPAPSEPEETPDAGEWHI